MESSSCKLANQNPEEENISIVIANPVEFFIIIGRVTLPNSVHDHSFINYIPYKWYLMNPCDYIDIGIGLRTELG